METAEVILASVIDQFFNDWPMLLLIAVLPFVVGAVLDRMNRWYLRRYGGGLHEPGAANVEQRTHREQDQHEKLVAIDAMIRLAT